MKSREHVMSHEMYPKLFAQYASAIGIDKEQSHPQWDLMQVKLDEIEAKKKIAEELALKKKAEEEAAEAAIKAEEEEAKRIAEEAANQSAAIIAKGEEARKILFMQMRENNQVKYFGRKK